ncbi:MAG TPA: class I SAM-dependent methyltransferase [Opitutaceae bacterium]
MTMNVEEFYNNEAKAYDTLRWTGPIGNYVHRQYERLVAEALPIIPGARYLEVGCGTGRFTVPVAAQGVDLTAVDISDEMLATTRGKLQAAAVKQPVQLLKLDARDSGFAPASYDVVFSFNVINHVPEYERLITEVARVLKPGGCFVVGYPSLWSVYLPYAMLVNLTRRSIRRGVYTRWPSTPALVRQARGLGLSVERARGMFHCPAIRQPLVANVVATMLKLGGKLVEKGPLQAVASTRIMVFRKAK